MRVPIIQKVGEVKGAEGNGWGWPPTSMLLFSPSLGQRPSHRRKTDIACNILKGQNHLEVWAAA